MTEGAKRLLISQPAASKQLRELEGALGTSLFERTRGGIRPTAAGELLAGYARKLFALSAEAENAVRDAATLGRGVLALGASTTIGSYLLPEVLAEFRQKYPGVRVRVMILNTESIHREVTNYRVDIGLTEGLVPEGDLDAEVFARDELVVVAPPGDPLLRRRRVVAGDLAGRAFVLREAGSGTRAVQEQAIESMGIRVEEAMTLSSTEAIKRVVAAGVGLAVVSRLSVRSELEAKVLVMIPVAGLKIPRPLHIVRAKKRGDGPAVAAFRATLADVLTRGR